MFVGSNRVGIYVDLAEHRQPGTVTSVVTRPTSVTLLDGSVVPAALRHAGDGPGPAPDPHRRTLVVLAVSDSSSKRGAPVGVKPPGPLFCTSVPLPVPVPVPDGARISWVERRSPTGAARRSRARSSSCGRLKEDQPELGSAIDLQIQLLQMQRRVQSRVPLPP